MGTSFEQDDSCIPLDLDKASELYSNLTQIPQCEIQLALRAVGYRDVATAPLTVLTALSHLRTRFQSLRPLFPNLTRLFELFDVASSLDPCAIPEAPWPEVQLYSVVRNAPNNFIDWLLHKYKPSGGLKKLDSESVLALDVIAIRWIYSAASHFFGDQFSTKLVPSNLRIENPESDWRTIRDLTKGKKGFPAIALGAISAGYSQWLAEVEALNKLQGEFEISIGDGEEYEGNFSQIPSIVTRLKAVRELPILPPPPTIPIVPTRLNERQLLKTHWYFPRPQELENLQKYLTQKLTPLAPATYAAGLIALAIFACRPVQQVLEWRIFGEPVTTVFEDRIEWVEAIGNSGKPFRAAVWRKTEHGVGKSIVRIYLPFDLMNWLAELHSGSGVGSVRLVDLLPITAVPWDIRAYTLLSTALNCSAERAEILTRDLVPRLIYHQTANSALVRFWRSSTANQIERIDRVALSHYLRVGDGKSLESFNSACTFLFNGYSLGKRNQVLVQIGANILSSRDTANIFKALNADVSTPPEPHLHHLAVSVLTLFVCIACSGHRRSSRPFPFPWDFHFAEGVVFIADKLVTGSEARFIPLPMIVRQTLHAYSTHLRSIVRNKHFGTEVRNYANSVLALLETGVQAPTQALSMKFEAEHGVFFEISSDGQRITKQITTNRVDKTIESRTGIKQVVRRLRPTVAQYLWEQGCTGREVQTFLGHQPELHSHGPASTWSIRDWAERIEPHLQEFASKYGFASMPIAGIEQRFPSSTVPAMSVSSHGYEGRMREKEWAQQRARVAIRQEISEYLLAEPDETITEQEYRKIESRIRSDLSYDPAAQRRVSEELAKQIQTLRKRGTVRASAFAPVRTLTVPGPVETGFSRSLRGASVFRHVWAANVGRPIGNPTFDQIERIAQFVISLVCFDAVLCIEKLRAIVGSDLAPATAYVFEDYLGVRCQVVSKTHDYEFSVFPSHISSALYLGILSASGSDDELPAIKDVEGRVATILRKTMNDGTSRAWTLSQLAVLFRPYWMIRLPGAMYAVAIGEYRGPAADLWSEARLMGQFVPAKKLPGQQKPRQRVDSDDPRQKVRDGLRQLFSDARGVQELGKFRRPAQRKALREALNSPEAAAISEWRSVTQIADLLKSFIGRLLDSGGPVVKTLAFSSMEKYFGMVADALIAHGWDIDFESIESDALDDLFEKVSTHIADEKANFILELFHSHLRDEVGAPKCSPKWSNVREPIRIRASLVTTKQVLATVRQLLAQKDAVGDHASLLIIFCFAYGLRKMEAIGLGATQFDEILSWHLSVQRTYIADLKTKSGRRTLPTVIDQIFIDFIQEAVAKARTSPRDRQFLFEDLTGEAWIANIGAITNRAVAALREICADPNLVLHSLRHSFATLLGIACFARPDDEILHVVAKEILGSQYQEIVNSILSTPSGWPFVVDALAKALGHVDVATFLDTYFHGSNLVIASRCFKSQPLEPIQDSRLAAMLNRERSSTTKMRGKLEEEESSADSGWTKVVKNLVRATVTSEYGQRSDPLPARQKQIQVASGAMVARALRYRFEGNTSLSEMAVFASAKLGFSSHACQSLVSIYENLVKTTGLDDFEPVASTIVRPIASHSRGVIRGAVEREGFIARAEDGIRNAPNHSRNPGMFLSTWFDRVDPIKPYVVCQTQLELENALSMLKIFGSTDQQITFSFHCDLSNLWLDELLVKHPKAPKLRTRASRGNARAIVSEVALSISQVAGSQCPDGRDLHRALIPIYIAHRIAESN